MDAQPNSAPPSAKVLWLVWLTAIALAVGSVLFLAGSDILGIKATAFRQTARGWERLPPLAAPGYRISISDSGVAWVQTSKGLSRLDGASWRSFTAADFGTKRGYLPGRFTLDGDEVWGAAFDGVVHFDGQRWRFYPNALATRQPTSIAAAGGQAWVIDADGNLSHFEGGTWAVRMLDLPGVRWSEKSGPDPKLAATANGTLWLAYRGLWRYAGTSWTRVPGVAAAELLGVTSPGWYDKDGKKTESRGGVWVRDGADLVGFDLDGAIKVRYQPKDLGLKDSTRVYEVAGRPPIFAVTSRQGLVWFDGSRWHGEQLKELGMVSAASIAVAPGGNVWGIGYTGESRAGFFAILVLIPPIVAVIYSIWWSGKKARHQRQAAREAVLHATGAIPEDLQAPVPSPAVTAAGVVMVLVLSGVSYWLVKRRWPGAPVWLLPAFFLAAHTIATVTGSLKKRKPLPNDPIGPGGPPRYDWSKSLTAILGGVAVIVLLYGGSIARHFHIRWLAAIPGIAFLFGGKFLFQCYDAFRGYLAEREIKRCRYAKALWMLDGPLGWPSTALWKLMKTDALFYSGRAPEAETVLRGLVETEHDAKHKTLAFEHLGRVLLAQGRYDEAKRAFEAVSKLMSGRSAAYAGLAELRLTQGVEPVQALADAERALELHRDSLAERKGARERLAIIRGNQAWALARLGRSAESQEAIAAGAREMAPNYTPEVAGFYWRAGMAMLATENATAAVSHFRRAAELDPEGYYGRLAAKHLSQHSVWGAVGMAGSRG
jgi:tetratricopeptide (TPR) repeat protein